MSGVLRRLLNTDASSLSSSSVISAQRREDGMLPADTMRVFLQEMGAEALLCVRAALSIEMSS